MARRKRYNEDEEIGVFDLENQGSDQEDNSFFGHLIEEGMECFNCEYYGPMRQTRKGARCPKCRELVVPNDD